jgi:HEAT repeat protein
MSRNHFLTLAFLLAGVARAEEPRRVADLMRDLDDRQSLVREEAVELLTRAKAKEALPRLTKMLDDPVPSIRRRAAVALWKIDGQTKPAWSALSAAVRDPNAGQRRESLLMLRDLNPPDDEYVPLLIALLEDRDQQLAFNARSLLQFKVDQAVPAILAALPKADTAKRERLIAYLATLVPAQREKFEPALRDLMDKSDDRTRLAIVRVLMSGNRDSAATVAPVLAQLTASKDPFVKQESLRAAMNFRPARKDFVPLYRDALQDNDGYSRIRAIEALYELDKASLTETLPVLIASIKSADASRLNARQFLQRIGPEATPALKAIAELLAAGDEANIRDLSMFITQLGRLGPDALPVLIKLLKSHDVVARNNAATAIRDIGEPAVPQLLPLLKDDNPEVRRSAFLAVSHVGPAAVKALPQLTAALKDPDYNVRNYAITALQGIGRGAKDAVGPLLEFVKDEGQVEVHRAAAAQALGRIGPDAKSAAADLHELLNKESTRPPQRLSARSLKLCCALALWQIERDRKDALPFLLNYVKTDRVALTVRMTQGFDLFTADLPAADVMEVLKTLVTQPAMASQVLTVISECYADAPEAIPLLTDLLKDTNPVIRRRAATILSYHGAAGRSAAPVLAAGLRERFFPDAQTLAAIARLGPIAAEALPPLLELFNKQPAGYERVSLAGAIVAIDRGKGNDALDYLHSQIKPNLPAQIRVRAGSELAHVEPRNPELVPMLRELAGAKDHLIAVDALAALAVMKDDAKEALPAIRAQLKSDDAHVRLRAAEALWRITGKPDESLSVLAGLLAPRNEPGVINGRTSTFAIAAEASQIVGEIGPLAASALPQLRICANQSDAVLQRAATAAIKRIEKR